MKRIIALLLIPVFLLMTAGVAITSFYCKGKGLKSASIKKCCKDVDKGGCCKSETKVVKVEDDYVRHSSSFEFSKFIPVDLPEVKIPYLPEVLIVYSFKTYWDKAPPIYKGELYLLFHSLIV